MKTQPCNGTKRIVQKWLPLHSKMVIFILHHVITEFNQVLCWSKSFAGKKTGLFKQQWRNRDEIAVVV